VAPATFRARQGDLACSKPARNIVVAVLAVSVLFVVLVAPEAIYLPLHRPALTAESPTHSIVTNSIHSVFYDFVPDEKCHHLSAVVCFTSQMG
jgi:hypothetical protein